MDRTTRILRLDCSPRGGESASRLLADEILARLTAIHPDAAIVRRDLAANPPPLVDYGYTKVMAAHPTAASAIGVAPLAVSEELIGELESTDFLLLATPVNNFTVPAVLKLWLDQVARVGRAFESTPDGKIGKIADRPAIIVVSSGSVFLGEDARQPDFLTPYLTAILNCLGIFDISFIAVQAVGRTPERAWADARAAIAAHPCLSGGTP